MSEVFAHPEHIAIWQAAGEGKPVDWDALFQGYRSAVDWPVAAFYRELMEVYPAARVILTVRDPERWYESGRNTIFPEREWGPDEDIPPIMREHGQMVDTILWQGTFGGRVLDREHAIEVFKRHNRTVQETVPADRLLVYQAREGWEPLCSFLGVPVPEGESFPHVNDTAEFRARREARTEMT
jgi:hypothetical protein